VCRQISCVPPWQLYPGACGTSSATDNNTAEHNAPCLTRANTFPKLPVYPDAPSTLRSGHVLHNGHRLTSPDRHTTLVFGKYGNLYMRNVRGTIWQTHTGGKAEGGVLKLLHTGELVILNKHGGKVWSSHTARKGARVQLRLRNDAKIVIYDRRRAIWHRPARSW
ncbi:MAG TPA: hypothetical protein VGH43_14520, partial [Jatrophihabitans sp.]